MIFLKVKIMDDKKMAKIVIAAVVVGLLIGALFIAMSLNFFGVINIEGLPKGNSTTHVLIIGSPTLGEKVVLDNMSYALTYSERAANSFGANVSEELMNYDIVILDQSNVADKSVTASFSQGVVDYVSKGGKLVVVKNSGVYLDLGLGNISDDVLGWGASFGSIMPVECILGADTEPVCAEGKQVSIVGRVMQQDFDHPIMAGIQISPPEGQVPLELSTFRVQVVGGAKSIAYIKAENTTTLYPAIAEKKSLIGGTVVYFNYDPGLTPTILKNTLVYLK